jgi:hypothetical protein
LEQAENINEMLLTTSTLHLIPLIANIGFGFGLSIIIQWHFQKFGSTLSNRKEFSRVFPLIILTTILIISIVKSSLALSLGLVGALSIVRFRTPIKEPEELSYLFLSIAIGLGLGAGQTLPTIVISCLILICITLLRLKRFNKTESGLFLSLSWQTKNTKSGFIEVESILEEHAKNSNLRRFNDEEGEAEVLYYIDIESTKCLSTISEKLKNNFSDINITFLDQKNISSL